jgi:hypothetical protein
MLFFRPKLLAPAALAATALCCGCSAGTPTRVEMAAISPADAGAKAIELYDTNHDGVISGDELKKVPALKVALARFDTSGDGKVTAGNIAARIQSWHDQKVAIISVFVSVTLDGQPLDGATVTFEPEPFLGTAIQGASGTTDARGTVMLKTGDKTGTHVGLYKVKVSKQGSGKETIPARYNTDTELGAEIAQDVPEVARAGKLIFALKSQ